MCCRYYFSDEAASFTRKKAEKILPSASFRRGEILPSTTATILTLREGKICAGDSDWGFLSPGGKQLLINARSETAWKRNAFAAGWAFRRCVIAADSFKESNRDKMPVTFTLPDRKVICMAGLWTPSPKGERFTVLTTSANESVLPFHDRMPVILQEEAIEKWITDEKAAEEMIRKTMPPLDFNCTYEQYSLF